MVNRASTAEPGKNAAFDDGMASASPRVLVVEDDRDVAGLVGRELRALGFTVDVMGFAEDALAAARETEYSLMVVDIGLPDRDGLELVREMRKRSIAAPILMVTARGKVEDKVSGLANGADDYLVKPFAVPELRARIAALLRRPSSMKNNRLVVANIVVDRDALEAIVGGVSAPLTRKQFQLLELLARRKNHMTPKRMIEEALYSFSDEVSGNAIEAHISKLRQVLHSVGAEAKVETRRGIGYRLVETTRCNQMMKRPGPADLARLDPDGAFAARLAEDRLALARFADLLEYNPTDDDVLADLESLAHRLVGAAGTFGYPEISEAALALENGVHAARSSMQSGYAAAAPSLDVLIGAIDAAVPPTRQITKN